MAISAKVLEMIKDYRLVAGIITVMLGSWYDLRGEVKDVQHTVAQNKAVQDVEKQKQELKDGIQDQRLQELSEDVKHELRSLNRKLDNANGPKR